jgi:hypothetical protein
MSDDPSSSEKTTKVCPECRSEVDIKAKRCPQCRHKFPRLGAGGVLVALIFGWIVYSVVAGSTASAPSGPIGPAQARELGQDAYLRLPDNSDSSQLICLAPTKVVYDEYSKALMAKDYAGILDLTNEGLFCVHNGSQGKVIDRAFGLTKVRIVAGVLPVDADKVGESGYTASEWVVSR